MSDNISYFPQLTQGIPDHLQTTENVLKISNKAYLRVHPRLQWALTAWAPIIETRARLIDEFLAESSTEAMHKLLQAGVKPELLEAIRAGNVAALREFGAANGYRIETEEVGFNFDPADAKNHYGRY